MNLPADFNLLVSSPFVFYEIGIIVFILLSAFFSGTETALVSANRIKLESLYREGSARAERTLEILKDPDEALGMVLIGNNISNIAATAFITFIATKGFMLQESALIGVTAVQTVIFLIVCEISPKVISKATAEKHLMMFSMPLFIFIGLFRPLTFLALNATDIIKKIFRVSETRRSLVRSRDEIGLFFKMGGQQGIINHDHHSYITEILSIKNHMAFEVMTPTVEIISVDLNESVKKAVELIGRTSYSRLPVYDERVDNIIGYVHYWDILSNPDALKISDLIRPAVYVPSNKNVYELYLYMLSRQMAVVFVVDEYGGVVGMVTHEDIAEEVVGEIQTSEHHEGELISKISPKKFLLSGELDIEYFQKYFGISIEKKNFETLAGFVMSRLGRIPRTGERFTYKKNTFIVESSTERRVEKVLLLTSKPY